MKFSLSVITRHRTLIRAKRLIYPRIKELKREIEAVGVNARGSREIEMSLIDEPSSYVRCTYRGGVAEIDLGFDATALSGRIDEGTALRFFGDRLEVAVRSLRDGSTDVEPLLDVIAKWRDRYE